MCCRGAALVEYFGKQANHLSGFRLWISFVVVYLCWSLLNPDLCCLQAFTFKGMCYFNTSLFLLQHNLKHWYSVCFESSLFVLPASDIFVDILNALFKQPVTCACNLDYLLTLPRSALQSTLRPDPGLCPSLFATRVVPLCPLFSTSPPPHPPLCPHLSWAMNKELTPNCQPASRHAPAACLGCSHQ